MATIEQILEDEAQQTAEFEAQTIVTDDGRTIAELHKVMDAGQNTDDWKAPWAASVHHSMVQVVMQAVEFYHADKAVVVGIEPITGYVMMTGRGYQA